MDDKTKYLNKAISKNDYTETTIVVTGLFFLWGFITGMNGILSPKLKAVFHLDGFNTILVQSAFFGAYFIFSLIYYIISIRYKDLILFFGFRNAMITGLIISGIGCGLFFPAAEFGAYNIFISALFILAGGITILQIGANPYVTLLGEKKNAASKLILSQAFNSLGTTLAPFTGLLIFTNTSSIESASTVKIPYLGLSASLFFFAFLLSTSNFTNIFSTKENKTLLPIPPVTKHRNLVFGILCIFMYVGGEVAIGSFIQRFVELEHIGNISPENSSNYATYYWGSAMIGRFAGALFLSKMKKKQRDRLTLYLIFFVIAGSFIFTKDIIFSLSIIAMVSIQAVAYYVSNFTPSKTLGIFAVIVISLLLFGIFTQGNFAMWSIISIGLFNSIMFPVIMTLGLKNLGPRTYQGSSLLIMGIVGGALIPPLQAVLSDQVGVGVQYSFMLPIVCYTYIVLYAFWFSKPKVRKSK